jgi:membrane protein YqaA with SNARE-associated domain
MMFLPVILSPFMAYVLLFTFCFLFYVIPFVGPSTMILSGAICVSMPDLSPFIVALTVAFGSSIAKVVIYYGAFFLGKKFLGHNSLNRLQNYGRVMGKWKGAAIFLASATPIPDEPVLIATSLVMYPPLHFFTWFLLGKLVVTLPAAFVGHKIMALFGETIGAMPMMIASIIVTVAITVIMLKVDLPFGKNRDQSSS